MRATKGGSDIVLDERKSEKKESGEKEESGGRED